VTKKKIKPQVGGKKAKKPATTKIKELVKKSSGNAVLPKEIKSIISKKNAKLVIFEKKEKIPVLISGNKQININIAQTPLDFYSSPHIIDLSKYKAIEKTPPAVRNNQIGYADLPGGKILNRFKVFDFFILDNSEICKAFCKLSRLLSYTRPSLLFQAKNKTTEYKKNKPSGSRKKENQDKSHLFYGLKILRLKLKYLMAKDEILNVGGERQGYHEEFFVKPRPIAYEQPEPDNFSRPFILRFRTTVIFACICLLFAMPLLGISYYNKALGAKGQVLGEAEVAIDSLTGAKEDLASFNLESAKDKFNKAGDSFILAQGKLASIKSILTYVADILPIDNSYKSGKNLLEMGKRISFAGEHISKGLDGLAKSKNEPLFDRINNFKKELDESFFNLKLANESIVKINEKDIPNGKAEEFAKLKQYLPIAVGSINKLQNLFDLTGGLLAENDLRRYLIVFQNDNEIRPTGGFLGSFALIDIKSGKIANITIPEGGTYDINSGLTYLLKAPKPLTVINPKWQLQDANWWPDWPTSAKNIMDFFNKSGGPSVDGVIAINSSWLGEILDVTGPIELQNYGKTIDSKNFELEIQKSIELEAKEKNKPKKILAELSPLLISKIFNSEPKDLPAIATAILKGLANKDILIYIDDKNLENIIDDNNWGGNLKKSDGDYLNVVYANIGGGKTDMAINQKIYHKSEIADDGSIINTVLVERSHIGPLDDVFTNKSNREFVRFYVPKGSQLISAEGFDSPRYDEYKPIPSYLNDSEKLASEKGAKVEMDTNTYIYDEGNYTVFANWVTLNPGKTKESVLTYKLPFKIDKSKKYQMLLQKQPGLRNVSFSSEVKFPQSWQIGNSSNGVGSDNNQADYKGVLDADKFYWISFNSN